MRLLSYLFVSNLALAEVCLAASSSEPHPHQGVVQPFSGAPEPPSLSPDDLKNLSVGKPVLKQLQLEKGGRGIVVQDIAASPEKVWAQILNFSAYPRRVDNVKLCETYEKRGDQIYTRFVIGAMMMEVEYFIAHTLNKEQGWMTWTLDYRRNSDLDDSVGMWLVKPHPTKPGHTRLWYSVDVRIKGWVPKMVENLIAKSGLTKATAWVKREAEKSK